MTSMQTNGRAPIDIESQYDAQALMDQQARDLGTGQDVNPQVYQQEIKVRTEQGTELAATLFSPQHGRIKGAVMIAPATGVKRRFYTAFAEHLVGHGFAVMTFDNSGIGDSLSVPLKKSKTRLQDWGQVDMPAILNELIQRFPDTPYHLIGHSAGGQLIGLMPNAHHLASIVNYASSSGSLRNMRGWFRLQAHFFMGCYIPLNNAVFGLTRADWVGMGEPLTTGCCATMGDLVQGKGVCGDWF